MNPARHAGMVYRAANWTAVGRGQGNARRRGGDADPDGRLREMQVCSPGRSMDSRLSATEAHPDWALDRTEEKATSDNLPVVPDELQRVPDLRHARGRRHRQESVQLVAQGRAHATVEGIDFLQSYARNFPEVTWRLVEEQVSVRFGAIGVGQGNANLVEVLNIILHGLHSSGVIADA